MARILGFVVGGDTVNCIVFWNHTVVYVLCTKKGDTIFLAISCKKTQDLIKLLKRTHSYICTLRIFVRDLVSQIVLQFELVRPPQQSRTLL